MASDDYKKHITRSGDQGDEDQGGDSSQGGQSGQIEFHDFTLSSQYRRDDMLTGDEQKRLLSVHKDAHETRVLMQKALRDTRKDVKNGKIPLQQYKEGISAANGMSSQFKPNPQLENKAQFAGTDPQVNPLTTINEAITNEGDRNELRYRPAPGMQPKFNPRPLR